MHAGAACPPHQVVKITDHYPFLALLGRRDDQVLEGEVDTLSEGRGADNKFGETFLHGVLDRQPKAMRHIGVVRKDAYDRRLGRASPRPQMTLKQVRDLGDLRSIGDIDGSGEWRISRKDLDGPFAKKGGAVLPPAEHGDTTVRNKLQAKVKADVSAVMLREDTIGTLPRTLVQSDGLDHPRNEKLTFFRVLRAHILQAATRRVPAREGYVGSKPSPCTTESGSPTSQAATSLAFPITADIRMTWTSGGSVIFREVSNSS
jgi:hypothetical protein